MSAALEPLARAAANLAEPEMEQEIRELQDRVRAGRCFLTCIGQFKRGKSTLLNALIGEPVLPTGVVPVTSAITIVRYGSQRTACVRYEGGASEAIPIRMVETYVAEAHNPRNAKRVRAVEIAVPSARLESGLCLVDTPGIGSVFGANASATRDFVPQIDAALAVIGADPPVTGDELALVEAVSRETPELIVVLNKADRVTPAELREACEFARRILSDRLRRPVGRIYELSATERLSGSSSRDWAAFEDAVRSLATAREYVITSRVARRTDVLRRRLVDAIEERQGALRRPLAKSEERLGALRALATTVERSIDDLTTLLDAERSRVIQLLDERRRAFLARALAEGTHQLQQRLMILAVSDPSQYAALHTARSLARECIANWGNEIEQQVQELYQLLMSRFVHLANEFLRQLSDSDFTAGDLSGVMSSELQIEARPRFYFTDMLTIATPSPLRMAAGLLSPASVRRKAAANAAHAYLARLLETNVSRFTNDLAGRVAQSRQQLEVEIRRVMRHVVSRAEAALDSARTSQLAGEAVVTAELKRLEQVREDLMGTEGHRGSNTHVPRMNEGR